MVEDFECPNCKSIRAVTHRIKLLDLTVIEHRYQCGAVLEKDVPGSGWRWVIACILRMY